MPPKEILSDLLGTLSHFWVHICSQNMVQTHTHTLEMYHADIDAPSRDELIQITGNILKF